MSLLEVLITLGLASFVFIIVGELSLYVIRSYAALANYSDLNQEDEHALDTISREIRQTAGLVSYNTNGGQQTLVFSNWDGGQLTYTWSPATGVLMRKKTSQPDTVLLTQCDSLVFHLSQRNPSNNFTFYPASGTNTAKLVDVTWTCSRELLQAKVNTETVQTAKIVVRN